MRVERSASENRTGSGKRSCGSALAHPWLWRAAVAVVLGVMNLALAGCQPAAPGSQAGQQTVPSNGGETAALITRQPEVQNDQGDGAVEPALPNPASAFCEDEGNVWEMREGDGGSYGVCIFADGSECEEWAYFRGECQPGIAQGLPTAPPEATATAAPAKDGWQIYENEVPAYRFLYPAEATIEPGHDPQQTVTVVGSLVEDEYWPIFYISHAQDRAEYRPPEGVDLAQWLVEQGLLAAEDEAQVAEVRQAEREIGGETAVHTRFERSEQSYAYDKYFFAHAGQLYTIVILHTGDQEDWGLYDRFLDSFQFEPQAAQRFRNERYALRYPANLTFFENERPWAESSRIIGL